MDQHEDEAEEQPVDTSGDGPAVPEHPRAEFFAELLREGGMRRCSVFGVSSIHLLWSCMHQSPL